MRRALKYDLESGKFLEIVRADDFDPADRKKYRYECPENGCNCTVHWRKETSVYGHAETRPATFVKNPSSSHRSGCSYDIERIVRENHEYILYQNGSMHVRLNFPLGSAPKDRRPMAGYLTEQQINAAHNQSHIKPFSSLKDLTAFFTKAFGRFDSEAAMDVMVAYQGHEVAWGALFKGSNYYDKMLLRAQSPRKDIGETAPIVTVLQLDHEIDTNQNGKRRFVATPQKMRIDNRIRTIRPVVVCDDTRGPSLGDLVKCFAKQNVTVAISARPFYAGMQYGTDNVYLNIYHGAQITPVDQSYWKPIYGDRRQENFLSALENTSAPAIRPS